MPSVVKWVYSFDDLQNGDNPRVFPFRSTDASQSDFEENRTTVEKESPLTD